MGKLPRLAVVVVIAMLAVLVASGCGGDEQPCEKLSEATKKELRKLNRALKRKSRGATTPTYFVLTEMKRDLMATFPKVYGLSLEEIYDRMKDLDAELEAAIKDDQTSLGPTDALIRAKRQKDAFRRLLLEEGGNVPDEVFDELELMNRKLTELIETGGAPGQIDFMLEEKRNLMYLFPKPYGVPFPDVYRSLKAMDDQLDRGFGLGDGFNAREAYRAAKAEKRKLEEALRKACE